MNDPIDRLIAERQRLDRGFPVTALASLAAHLGVAGLAFGLPLLLPREPPLRIAEGFSVVLPRGGGGSPLAAAPPAAAPAPQPVPAAVGPAPAPESAQAPDSGAEAERPPAARFPPLRAAGPRAAAGAGLPERRPGEVPRVPPAGVPGGKGAGSATPGLEFGPPGPGVPDGTDTGGDWYLAGVQQKIWMLWNQQIKSGFSQPVGITFTILPDGNVTDVRVTQPSGARMLDMAAQRAVLNAAPFGALPRENGQNPRTIQALFKPAQ